MTVTRRAGESGITTAELRRLLRDEAEPLPLFRRILHEETERLFADFDEGIAVTTLVQARGQLVDLLLCEAWRLLTPPHAQAALAAVGGYGRQELHPGSDVDILILVEDGKLDAIATPLERLITFLWDVGLEVGHSVRTVEDCVREAEADVTVITNLIEARLLIGDAPLFARMRSATAPERTWPSEEFFAAKVAEQRARWNKYGDTAYNLEPNIKENPGGLRDIQMIGWVAKRHFGAESLHDLVTNGFLTEDEHLALVEGQALLWRIRFVLHRLAKRREDRLLFDYQRTLAGELGFRDGERNLAVEKFMQQYYRTVIELNRLIEMLLQLFEEAILLHDCLGPPQKINTRFQSRSGFLEVTGADVFHKSPLALLEVFYTLQTHPEIGGVRASTIRLIREHCRRIDNKVRTDLRARSLFMEILRHRRGLTHALRRMNRYGVLAAYIPAFANIVGRMQYDLFHVYTVDEHTLRVLRNLRRFSVLVHAHEFPLCSAIAHTIVKPELLYLAGLFHDIAKGRGGDHSLMGARDAWDFCRLHGLSDYDSRLVAWLVEKHLIMSMTAQRKDTGDPDVIQEFAAEVGDLTRLDYLYLLTVADMRATDPGRWNSWKDSMLRELYHTARLALVRGLDNPQAQDDLIQQKQAEAVRLVAKYGVQASDCTALWLKFNLDYFLQNSPDEIGWQTRLVLHTPRDALPLVAIRPVTARGGTEIFNYIPDQANLFSRTTALLDQLGLSIMDARIMTTDDGMALNSYYVLEREGSPIGDDLRIQEIQDALRRELNEPQPSDIQVARRPARQHKHFPTTTQISFSADRNNNRTVLRLITLDRPGLLAQVGGAFYACDVRLQNAKITTIGAEVEDVFFITDSDESPITCREDLACLREELRHRLDPVPTD